MSETPFVPPYPIPHRTKSSFVMRFFRAWNSWIHVLFEKSYTMKLGEVRLPGRRFLVANEAPLVARIMDDPLAFPKHGMILEMLGPVIGDSLLSSNGAKWARQRAIMNPSFQHTNLKIAFPVMTGAVADMIARIRASDLTRPIDFDPIATHVTADIIFRTLFSSRLDAPAAERIYRAFHTYQRHAQSAQMLGIYRLPGLGFGRRAEKAGVGLREIFAPLVRARFAWGADSGPPPRDILQSVIEARHPETGDAFTMEEVIDEVGIVFLAGHETSATAMTWALYLIAEHPALQERMLAEVEAATKGGPIHFETLRQLTLVRNVFRETLRLYPPITFLPRGVAETTPMRNKTVRPGDLLVVSPWLIQRSPNEWRCPHAFDPDRFEDPAEDQACKRAWLPFGKGPRVCVGQGFAQQEGVLALAEMVRAFRLSYPPGPKPEPISRVTLRAKRGIKLRFAKR